VIYTYTTEIEIDGVPYTAINRANLFIKSDDPESDLNYLEVTLYPQSYSGDYKKHTLLFPELKNTKGRYNKESQEFADMVLGKICEKLPDVA
tara:strand:- start:15899 stop:16174 length:276 start_codon:yes stop_codon:yes gene_type:complete